MATALGDWLDGQMARRGWGLRPAADAIGKHYTTVRAWRLGHSRPSWEHCELIAAAFDADVDVVRRLAGYEWSIPVAPRSYSVAEVPAGYSLGEVVTEEVTSRLHLVRVGGDCLEGLIEPDVRKGDMMFVNVDGRPAVGAVVIVTTADGPEFRLIARRGRHWVFTSSHGDEPYDGERVQAVAETRLVGL